MPRNDQSVTSVEAGHWAFVIDYVIDKPTEAKLIIDYIKDVVSLNQFTA